LSTKSNAARKLNSAGWIKFHRETLDDPLVGLGLPVDPWKPGRHAYTRLEAFLSLVAAARTSPKEFDNKGASETLWPGQVLASHRHFAKLWNWSPSAVYRWMSKLDDRGYVKIHNRRLSQVKHPLGQNAKKAKHPAKHPPGDDEHYAIAVLTIIKWSIFEHLKGYPGKLRNPRSETPRETRAKHERNNYKNDNNYKNVLRSSREPLSRLSERPTNGALHSHAQLPAPPQPITTFAQPSSQLVTRLEDGAGTRVRFSRK